MCLCDHCCSGKSLRITYSQCVFVALGTQYAMCMYLTVICSLSGSTKIFHGYLISRKIFKKKKKKVIEHKTCFDFLYNFCLKHLSLWEEQSKIWLKMYIGIHVKYRFFLSEFNETWIYLKDFKKILQYQISWKSIQWKPSCSTWTDMTKLIVTHLKIH